MNLRSQPALPRLIAVAILGVMLTASAAGRALAVDQVTVDDTTVTAVRTGDAVIAEMKLINLANMPATLPGDVQISAQCMAQVPNLTLQPLQATTVKVNFAGQCFADGSPSLLMDLDDAGNLPAITVARPADEAADWAPAIYGTSIGFVAGLWIFIAGWRKYKAVPTRKAHARGPRKAPPAVPAEAPPEVPAEAPPEVPAELNEKYSLIQALVNSRVADLGAKLNWRPLTQSDYGYDWLSTPVAKLESGWSLQGSFVANLTLSTTAVIALIASVDTATAILGDEPKAALRTMAVVGLVSAVMIAIANAVSKIGGPKPSDVTPFGLAFSTSLVVWAAVLQTVSVGGTAAVLFKDVLFKDIAFVSVAAIVLTIVVCVVAFLYAHGTLRQWIGNGSPTGHPTIPSDVLTSWDGAEPWKKGIILYGIRDTFASWLAAPEAEGGGEASEDAATKAQSAVIKAQVAQLDSSAEKLLLGPGASVQLIRQDVQPPRQRALI